MIAVMDTILDRPWTTESFLAWEDRQEFKHEFDGQRVIPMTGGTIAHQRIVFNLCLALLGLLEGQPLLAIQEMRLRIGRQIRYPDVMICTGPLDQTTRTLTDALAQPSPHSDTITVVGKRPVLDTASANFSISGTSRCCGMVGISS